MGRPVICHASLSYCCTPLATSVVALPVHSLPLFSPTQLKSCACSLLHPHGPDACAAGANETSQPAALWGSAQMRGAPEGPQRVLCHMHTHRWGRATGELAGSWGCTNHFHLRIGNSFSHFCYGFTWREREKISLWWDGLFINGVNTDLVEGWHVESSHNCFMHINKHILAAVMQLAPLTPWAGLGWLLLAA